MDMLSLLRTTGGLGMVLGLLAAALWIVRRYDIALPGRVGRATDKRLAVIERVQLDQRRAVVLVRRDGFEHLFVLLPDRVTVLETGIARTPVEPIRKFELCPPARPAWHEDAWYNA